MIVLHVDSRGRATHLKCFTQEVMINDTFVVEHTPANDKLRFVALQRFNYEIGIAVEYLPQKTLGRACSESITACPDFQSLLTVTADMERLDTRVRSRSFERSLDGI